MAMRWQRWLRFAALAVGLLFFAPSATVPLGLGAAPAFADTTTDDLASTYTKKLCEIYSTGKQLVYIALGIGILVVVVLSIGSRFRTGLFMTLVASVVIVATTDQLLKFLSPKATVCDVNLASKN